MHLRHAKFALSTTARLHASFWRNPFTEVTEATGASTSNGHQGQNLPNGIYCSMNEAPQVTCSENERAPDKSNDGVKDIPQAPGPVEPVLAAPSVLCSSSGKKTGSLGEARDMLCRGRGSDTRRYAAGLHPQGTFSSLEKRDPGDLVGLEEEYRQLLCRFRALLPAEWFDRVQQEQQQQDKKEETVGGDQGDWVLREVGAHGGWVTIVIPGDAALRSELFLKSIGCLEKAGGLIRPECLADRERSAIWMFPRTDSPLVAITPGRYV